LADGAELASILARLCVLLEIDWGPLWLRFCVLETKKKKKKQLKCQGLEGTESRDRELLQMELKNRAANYRARETS
jgi:hypothetical protein